MRTPVNTTLAASDGLALNLVDFGGGGLPALLLVHGTTGHARTWDGVVAALPPGRRALALDLPGHGLSAHAAPDERYALATVLHDVDAAVAAAPHPLVLVGHSVGSALVMFYAAEYRRRLAGAVLVDIDPCPPQSQADRLNGAGARPPRRFASFEAVVEREAQLLPAAGPEMHQHLTRHGYREDGDGFVQRFDPGFLRAFRTWDARPLLPAIGCPVLAVRGGESAVMSPHGFAEILAGVPDVRGVVIPHAGHQVHLEQPGALAAAIEEFVAGLPPVA